ncbi:FAD-binding protein [Pseudomonas oryzae]|uniref:3-oxo-5alpha-steroid 4-dehydrogenase n=1 Tax=Pseudomonas oryzae TaxID=1392877 RepID=A0A1H1PAC6_9PSED|nr:FAD-binding protein [Pseudomonas oryzae]SDS08103.1 3-oxo-5alpha-steroid 4-dehydrogenase [Pseudomonas oryzae]
MTQRDEPGSPHWHSPVRQPERVADAAAVPWDDAADFLVVGYGGAGIAAALEAAEQGLEVLALDAYDGGGSTAMNGGVVYAGGGTAIQRAAGVEDSVDDMFRYLRLETQGVVRDSTLRRFCEQSAQMIDWLSGHGVRFDSTLYAAKTSYPPQGYHLYHSDNTLLPRSVAVARPAARGHKVYSPPTSAPIGFGVRMTDPLRERASRLGVRFMAHSEVRQLIVDHDGNVLGVKVLQMPPGAAAAQFARLMQQAARFQLMLPASFPGSGLTSAIALRYWRKAEALKNAHAVERRICARHGVCLSSGGFIQNRAMANHYAPAYANAMPLGSLGDNGSGIRLGQSVGAVADRLGRISSWRFLNPPKAFAEAMLVNGRGERYCNEMLYGAAIGQIMGDEQDGAGLLILDRALYRKAWQQVRKDDMLPFQRQPAILALLFASRKARSLDELARKCGLDPQVLEENVRDYNQAAAGWQADPFGKDQKDIHAIAQGPFYAIDVSIRSRLFPLSAMTVGGLRVDEDSGQVLRADDTPIGGLYAAGRTAIGLPSHLYISGLSAADCIFSGRRAAAHVARQRAHQKDAIPAIAG